MVRFAALAATAALAGCAAPPPPPQTTAAIPELTGRVAGAPQRCVTFQQREGLRIAGPHALVYGTGRTVWLNNVPACSTLHNSDILVLEPIGSRYCAGDFVRTRDPVSKLPGPGCRLGEFIPFTRG